VQAGHSKQASARLNLFVMCRSSAGLGPSGFAHAAVISGDGLNGVATSSAAAHQVTLCMAIPLYLGPNPRIGIELNIMV